MNRNISSDESLEENYGSENNDLTKKMKNINIGRNSDNSKKDEGLNLNYKLETH